MKTLRLFRLDAEPCELFKWAGILKGQGRAHADRSIEWLCFHKKSGQTRHKQGWRTDGIIEVVLSKRIPEQTNKVLIE